jgi:uncharacterized Fe-S center protein
MATVEFDIEATCNQCGSVLSVAKERAVVAGEVRIEVDPCDKCMDNARDEGRREAK